MGGARLRSPIHSRLLCVLTGEWIAARILRRPLNSLHFKTSISKTLIIREAQTYFRRRPLFSLWSLLAHDSDLDVLREYQARMDGIVGPTLDTFPQYIELNTAFHAEIVRQRTDSSLRF